VPPEEVYKFYGVDIEEADEIVKQEALRRTQQKETSGNGQNYDDALRVFYGVDATQTEAPKLEDPIPGYCGFNRRIQADNIFGMTYAEARRRAQESQNRIEVEKAETLKTTSKFFPEYLKPKNEDQWA
jgi:hypothetical protein